MRIESYPIAAAQESSPAPKLRELEPHRPAASAQARLGSKSAMRIQGALSSLLEAAALAQESSVDVWEFAVELAGLHDLGLTNSECRWMVAKGLALHAHETSRPDAQNRDFQPCANLSFSDRTCFVITARGRAQANAMLRSGAADSLEGHSTTSGPVATSPGAASGPGTGPCSSGTRSDIPTWDSDRQQLRIGNSIIKQFKVPAANQEAILAAFQEENWAPRIDDPLAPTGQQDAKRRLHDTINSLNRNQKTPLIRFLGDGKGEGVRWEFTSALQSGNPNGPSQADITAV